jgi:hypothetical protein
MILVVPMDPQYLPEAGLLFGGIVAAVTVIHYLLTKQSRKAIRSGLIGLGCVGVAVAMALTLHNPPGPPPLVPAMESSMSLVLGDVVLRVAPSERYVLSANGRQFLVLDLHRSRLKVSGVVGTHDQVATGIQENTFPYTRPSGVRPARDAHTLLVQEGGKAIARVEYAEPRRIEVTGQFFGERSDEAALISLENGISWRGGAIHPGATIDLRNQGPGRIDFGPSGAIRIVPQS